MLIRIDNERLATRGVTTQEVIRALRDDNFALAGGYVREGGKKFYVRSISKFYSLEQIHNTLIRSRVGDLRLREIADIVYDVPERGRQERLDGQSTVSLLLTGRSTSSP